jgi:peptidoglycan/LPS O-acetylase OafA/YrhL
VLGLLFVADFFILTEVYSMSYILKSVFGIFTEANMYSNVDSPLWYFSLILFYYLLFPVFFSKKWPWATAVLLYFSVWGVVQFDPPLFAGVIGLYQVHMIAFPLGVFIAWLVSTQKGLDVIGVCKKIYTQHNTFVYPVLVLLLIGLISYFSIHANVGGPSYLEQDTSLLISFAIGLLFLIKKRESKLFSLFGFFSYEIYLFHWPLMYHYDFLYKFFPASVATVLYLVVFIGLAFLLQKCSSLLLRKK